MNNNAEICRDQERRRQDIRKHTVAGKHDLNGIDYLEVDDQQTTLTVYFIGAAPANLSKNNIRIDGGIRIRNIKVQDIHRCDPRDPRADGCLQVEVDRSGDFSTYTLRLVNVNAQGRPGNEPLAGFDPRYALLDFSFKANCPSDLDCAPVDTCALAPLDEPEINYLGKDYASFRQLILDRLSFIMPDWKERHVPDLGITLVELLAYTGDYLSYYQDAVATEAYLDTARQRISVRRHAKLVDYEMHEGCNARAWVYIEADEDTALGVVEDVYFISSATRSFNPVLLHDDLREVPYSAYEVFEPIIQDPNQPLQFFVKHNNISFYTWHERECCLPRGATTATLIDEWAKEEQSKPPNDNSGYGYPTAEHDQKAKQAVSSKVQQSPLSHTGKPDNDPGSYKKPGPWEEPPTRSRLLHLKVGDALIFEERIGPVSGVKADADPSHRHVVRLTKVEPGVDPLYDQPIVDIEWAREDALPFSLCISTIGRAPECLYLTDVSVAHGNVLLVDHGRRIVEEAPESWDVPTVQQEDAGCWAEGEPRETLLRAGAFHPQLKYASLTYRVPFPMPSAVANQQFHLLSRLMSKVRARVEHLWRKTRDGHVLGEDELKEIAAIFGPESQELVGSLNSDEQAREFEQLIRRADRLWSKKSRRVRSLAARAMAGYVLGKFEEDELAETFGTWVIDHIGLRSSQLLGPASAALLQDPRDATPAISVVECNSISSGTHQTSLTWLPQSDLLESNGQHRHFVVETDNEGRAHLRFGEGDRGRAPVPETTLSPTYRVGNGTRGNVGAEVISHFVFRNHISGRSPRVRNPLPAQGGVDPEPLTEAKLFAPMTFRRKLKRAVTPDDYARLARESGRGRIQQAAAGPFRWTGSWYEVQVAIDQFGAEGLDQDLRELVEGALYQYRRIGHDLRVQEAKYVALDIVLSICVLPHYLRADVKRALLDLFSNRVLPEGKLGFFHPNNLSFGEGVYLSKLVATAQGVAGVESVRVKTLQRLYEGPNEEIDKGVLSLGPLEVGRLSNDKSFPEHGKLFLDVEGGR
jgi:hypothetical protein